MPTQITLDEAARLNGDATGTYRPALSRHLRTPERYPTPKKGQSVKVYKGDMLELRLLTEIGKAKLNIDDAALHVKALRPILHKIITEKIGVDPGSEPIFILQAWGYPGDSRILGFVCEGRSRLNSLLN